MAVKEPNYELVAPPSGIDSNKSKKRLKNFHPPLNFNPGFFCASSGRAVASGLCAAGHYCLSGARSPTPEDGGTTGDRCPKGHYCPRGSSTPLPCPAGLYSDETRNSRLSDCLPCPAGLNPYWIFIHVGFNGRKQAIDPCSENALNGWHDPPPPPVLRRFLLLFQDCCVSPEGSLPLLKCVRLALTVQAAAETAAGSRRLSAHLETSARRDQSDRCPARQGPTRICPDRCQHIALCLYAGGVHQYNAIKSI